MATVNYPEILPHPLVSDGYGFRPNQSQAVSLFDVETQSRDETRTVNVGFTFTDLQYKVFHGWFMNVLVHGQKWFNMRLDGEFFECTFGGNQPQYSLNRKIITVTTTLKTRPNTGFVNYTNQRVTYPDVVNYMPSPFDPNGWTDGGNGTVDNVTIANPTGEPVLGLAVQDGTSFFTMQDSFLNDLSVVAGEKLYIGIVLKPVDANPFDISIVVGGSVTPIKTLKIAVEDLSVRSSNMTDYQITDLGDGFKLIQAYWVAEADDPDTYGRYTFTASNAGTAAPIGSQVYAQAAYFGKNPLEFPYAFYDEFGDKTAGKISYLETNYMPSPFDPNGWTDGGNGTVDNVTLDNPSGEPVLGLAVQDGTSFFTMQDSFLNDLSVVAGEKLYIGIVLKPVDANPFDIFIVVGGSVTPIKTLKIAVEDLSVRSSNMTDYQITDLGDGFKLIQAYWVAEADDPDTYGRYTFTASNAGTAAPIGSQVYAQAAYFGKADDWPARFNNTTNWDSMSANLNVDNGILSFKAANNDPQMESNVDFDGSKYTNVIVRWKRNSGLTSNQMFWGNDQGGFAAERAISFGETTTAANVTTETSGDFFITTIDMSGDPKWTDQGNVQGIRFDFGNSLASDFDIDYIKIYSPERKEVYDNFWPAKIIYEY